jgi:hypothetical protein
LGCKGEGKSFSDLVLYVLGDRDEIGNHLVVCKGKSLDLVLYFLNDGFWKVLVLCPLSLQ